MKYLSIIALCLVGCGASAPDSYMSWERMSVGKCFDVDLYMKPIKVNKMECPHPSHMAFERSKDTKNDILAIYCVCQ